MAESDEEIAEMELEPEPTTGAEPQKIARTWTDAEESHVSDRLKFLLGTSDVYKHFIQPPTPKKKGKKGDHGRNSKARKTEEEEDKEMLGDLGAEKTEPVKIVERLETQPSVITGKMRAYQLEGLNWMINLHNKNINGILADEMGLGKTLQSISILGFCLEFYKIRGPHIVIVPKSTLGNWCRELARWCPDFKVLRFHGNKEERISLRNNELASMEWDVCVTSYEMVLKEKNALSRINWEYIVIDEAHRIKNENSSLSVVIRMLPSKHRLLLTGTPLQNNLHELWALLNFLLPDVFKNADDFDSFFDLNSEGSKQSLIKQLHSLVRPFLLRRLKTEVEKDLPPKKELMIMCGLSEMQQYYYKKLIERDIDAVNGVSASRSRLLNILMQLRKCCNHPYLFDGAEPGPPYINGPHIIENSGKMVILDKLLPRLKAQDSRVLIFSQMTRLLDLLEDYCWMKEYEYCRIDGSTDSAIRDDHIEAFNKPGSTKFLFLLSTRAGGLGINLATADIVILYDSDWNPQVDLQAQDRAHRIGQTKPVKVFRFVTEKSVEERIIERATKKLKLDALVIQQGRLQEQSKALSKNDLIGMIKYGADEVLRAKGSTITDSDIEKILESAEEQTKEIENKISKTAEESLYNFTMDGGIGSVYDYKDPKDEDNTKLDVLTTWIEPSKRERKKNYNEDQYFRSAMSKDPGGPKAPKLPKMPQTHDFQFYNSERLRELIEIERTAILTKHQKSLEAQGMSDGAAGEDQAAPEEEIRELSEEEIREKERLMGEGFQEWSKRDFNNYVRACEKFGRAALEEVVKEVEGKSAEEVKEYHVVFWKRYKEIAEFDRIIKKIEAGEEKIQRRQEIEQILKHKVLGSKDPYNQLKINYGQNKGKAFNEEEDRYMICSTQKLGYGNWEELKAAIRSAWQFRFDWFIKSRTPTELGRRVDTLIRLIEKEEPESTKRKAEDSGNTSGKKAKV
eukprot:TRINITY_DN10043_c0_g2_i1.p1 TRINITY_DN10043_c0_g2~~TRINITY_DN10043_c0_g2_i1.p1  ORF type:complete len:965 (+),score=286.55 TRINITY_DN10043_c0_g2_i1:52-2946(+)